MNERTNHYRGLIGLLKVHELGPRRIHSLLKRTQVRSADEIFTMPARQLLGIEGIGETVARNISNFKAWKEVDEVLEKTARMGAALVAFDDYHYPEMLRQIYDVPVLLWVMGDKEVLKRDGIAVIGTRIPGEYGRAQATHWSESISQSGLCVNSGLAYGVDTIAHQSALRSGGKTVAVLGSGIDVIYPARNKPLVRAIIEGGGAVITEYLPGTQPDAVNFPGRNRIVSGMSHGVLVIESKLKGGSMITARYALDQNREVFVIPHPLGDPSGEGCNYLIKTAQGKLVQSLQDIFDELSLSLPQDQNEKSVGSKRLIWRDLELTSVESKLCELLEEGELHIDKLSEKSAIQVHELHGLLLELELRGAIRQKAGKIFQLL